MKQITLTTITSLAFTTLLLTGCGSESTTMVTNTAYGERDKGVPATILEAIDGPLSTLTQDAKDTLAFMGNEERLAYDVYMGLYNYHLTNSATEIKSLYNIANNAERYHINSIQLLVTKYITDLSDFSNINSDITQAISLDMNYATYSVIALPEGSYNIDSIQELYDALMAKGMQSKIDALEVGCMVEVTDINDLNDDLIIATASGADDIITTFEYLKEGSYAHYWAFDKNLKNEGISDGCCSLGTEYCHPEYPQIEHGNKNS